MTGEPLRIARIGSFYAGGRQVEIAGEPVRDVAFTRTASMTYNPNGLFHFEQAYVQFFIPEIVTSPLPLVLLHGGGFTGAMWETTPDGRPGWLEEFLRLGFPVYVVDNVERGRAGWCPFPKVWPGEPIMRTAEEAWSLFRIGDSGGFASRLPFPGQRFPAFALDVLMKGCVPRWVANNDVAVDAFEAVIERIGPCAVLAHSHGGEVAFRAAARHPDLVPMVAAIEPSGFAEDAGAFADGRVLFVMGDFLGAAPLWRSLAERTRSFCEALEQAGCDVDFWHLPERGVFGNSHMLMMDDNSGPLAQLVADWLLRPRTGQVDHRAACA